MKILVDRLGTTPADFHWEAGSAWWQAEMPPQPGLPREVLEPFRFDFAAHRMGEDVYIEGTVVGAVELECSRCLARYGHVLRDSYRLILEPAGARVPTDPEAAEALRRDGVCLGDEIEAGWFRGDEIRLGAFFREVVSLALPVKPLCDEDCPGLCPHCGIELGKKTCDCRATQSDSPFAALAALRDGPRGGSH